MNKVFKSVFLLLCLLNCQFNLLTIEEQRRYFDSFIEDRRTIVINNDKYDDLLIVFSKDAFKAYRTPCTILDISEAQALKKFMNVLKHDEMATRYEGLGNLVFSKPNITFESSCFVDLQSLFIEATKSIVLKNVIIESMETILRGDIITLTQCIVEGDTVRLESKNKNTSVYSITITFKDKSGFDIPPCMFVNIDFNNDKIELLCSGVSKVEFKTNLHGYSVRTTDLMELNSMLRFGSDMSSTYEMFD